MCLVYSWIKLERSHNSHIQSRFDETKHRWKLLNILVNNAKDEHETYFVITDIVSIVYLKLPHTQKYVYTTTTFRLADFFFNVGNICDVESWNHTIKPKTKIVCGPNFDEN